MGDAPDEVRTYTPTAKQQAFHASPAKYRLLLGAYGSGKTCMLCWEAIMFAMEFPGSLGVVFRRYYPGLRDTTKRDFGQYVPNAFVAHEVKTEGREEIQCVNGSRVLFRCLDDWRKLGSTQFDWVAIDEAWEVDEQEFRALALGRLRGRVGPLRLVCATNPPDDTHWLHTFFVDEADEDKAVFPYSTYDNRLHLPKGYIERMERSMTEPEKKKFLRGEWGILADGKPVFDTFREDLHVGDFTPIRGRTVLRGWDFGFVHPACVWLQTDPSGYTAVLHELLGEQEDIERFARRVLQETQEHVPGCPVEDYCDVAGNQRHDRGLPALQILRRPVRDGGFGLAPHTRKLPVQKTLEGIRHLIGNLHNGGIPLLRIDRSCKKTIKAFGGGYYVNKRGEPTGDNVYDHLIDALRYALAPTILPLRSTYEGKPFPRTWAQAV